MKELSMHILDIVENSIAAGADKIQISILEDRAANLFQIEITDNGKGMPKEIVDTVRNPFTTTRTTRKVGLGIPLLEQTCLQTEGQLEIDTKAGKGTAIKAVMQHDHIDRPPLGDIASTLYLLILMNKKINFDYCHQVNENEYELNMEEIWAVLDGLPVDSPEVSQWLKENIDNGIKNLYSL